MFKALQENASDGDHIKIDAVLNQHEDIKFFIEHGDREFKSHEGWKYQYDAEGYDLEEKSYRSWCLQHRLFANCLNDLTTEWIADRDILQFPDHVVSVGAGPYLAAAFSALKREYCFARFMAYEGIHGTHPDYENQQLFLVDTLDGVEYGGAVEKTKTAFRVCFSVFDSIAFILNAYFKFGSNQVAFTPTWIRRHFSSAAVESAKNVNIAHNPFVDALFWLSCDLFDNEKTPSNKWKAPNPSAAKIRKIRNAIEHCWLRVCDKNSAIWDKDSDFSYAITLEELEEQTLELLKLARSAMLYLCMAVTYHEKNQSRDGGLIVPNVLHMVDDEFIAPLI